jgi:hypothetical protein
MSWQQRYVRLQKQLDALSDQERQAAASRVQDAGVGRIIATGDSLSLMAALQEGLDPSRTDDAGLCALHHAAGRDATDMTAALLSRPSAAPWQRDRHGRLPLDLAVDVGGTETCSLLERATYPEMFAFERDGALPENLVSRYAALYTNLQAPATHRHTEASPKHRATSRAEGESKSYGR